MQRKRVQAAPSTAKRSRATKSAKATTALRTQKDLRRTGRKFNQVTFVPSLGPLGFPSRLRANLRYKGLLNKAFTTAQSVEHAFACNGMYDPDITATGTQPYYFDQLMSIYNHYTVVGAKITVTLQSYTSSSSLPLNFGIAVNDDATVNAIQIREDSRTQFTSVNLNSSPVTLNNVWSARATFGPGTTSDPSMRGNVAANPTELSTFVLYLKTNGVDTVTAFFNVAIEYAIIFSELADASTS